MDRIIRLPGFSSTSSIPKVDIKVRQKSLMGNPVNLKILVQTTEDVIPN